MQDVNEQLKLKRHKEKYVLEALENTSEFKPVTQRELLNIIETNYGLKMNIKTLRSVLKKLADEDVKIKKGHNNRTMWLDTSVNQIIDRETMTFLLTCVHTNPSISSKASKRICNKIISLYDNYIERHYKYILDENIPRCDNEEVLKNIDQIQKAIVRETKIEFNYINYDEKYNEILGEVHLVSPYYVECIRGELYLLCLDEDKARNGITAYRVALIKNVKIRKDLYANKILKGKIGEYLTTHIYPFNDSIREIKIRINDKRYIRNIVQWFGKKSKIVQVKDKYEITFKCEFQSAFYWCMQYLDVIEVLEPQRLVKAIKEACEKTLMQIKTNFPKM